MNQTGALWLVPLTMAAHNAEEAVTIPAYLPRIISRVPEASLALVGTPTLGQVQAALLLVTIIPAAIAVWMTLGKARHTAVWLLLLIQATLLLNVAWHTSAAIMFFRGYAPGLVTALGINLPFSIYLFRRAAREQWASPGARLALLPGALVLHGPALIGLLLLAQQL